MKNMEKVHKGDITLSYANAKIIRANRTPLRSVMSFYRDTHVARKSSLLKVACSIQKGRDNGPRGHKSYTVHPTKEKQYVPSQGMYWPDKRDMERTYVLHMSPEFREGHAEGRKPQERDIKGTYTRALNLNINFF